MKKNLINKQIWKGDGALIHVGLDSINQKICLYTGFVHTKLFPKFTSNSLVRHRLNELIKYDKFFISEYIRSLKHRLHIVRKFGIKYLNLYTTKYTQEVPRLFLKTENDLIRNMIRYYESVYSSVLNERKYLKEIKYLFITLNKNDPLRKIYEEDRKQNKIAFKTIPQLLDFYVKGIESNNQVLRQGFSKNNKKIFHKLNEHENRVSFETEVILEERIKAQYKYLEVLNNNPNYEKFVASRKELFEKYVYIYKTNRVLAVRDFRNLLPII